MKKPLKEDKADSKTGIKRTSLAIFLLLFFSSASPQVPINGFCQLNTFPAFPGFSRMTIADVNSDSFNDVLLFSPSEKNICIIFGKEDGNFTDYKILNTPYQFSRIVSFHNIEKGSNQFFFTSRKKRIVGLFEFSNSTRINFITKMEFDSFPENIDVADIDGEGNPECLVSGSGFSGLSILSYREGKLLESKINVSASFEEAVFADVSNDGYPDILAFNILTESMDIYFNDSQGVFEKVRSIIVKGKINNLKAVDINKDFYTDLIFTTQNSINIIFGDFQSAYKNHIIVNTLNNPDQLSVSDFNEDRYQDFAYIDSSKGVLSFIYGKGFSEFYPDILYMADKELAALYPSEDGESSKLLMLNKKGKLNVISRLSDLPDKANILPAVQPSTIATFDYANNGIPDICYIDNFTHTINFLVNDWNGIPVNYYSAPVLDEHTKIFPFRITQFKKEFYCFSPNGKMLEIIEFDFNNNKYDSDQLYLPGIAKDLIIYQSGDSVHIVIAYEKEKKLYVGEYYRNDFRYNFRDFSLIDSNVISPKLSLTNGPQISYWKNNKGSITLIKTDITFKPIKYEKLGTYFIDITSANGNISQYMYDKSNFISISFINLINKFQTITSIGKDFNISNPIAKQNSFVVSKENILSFEGKEKESSYSGILYLSEDHSFNRIEINDEGIELLFSRLIEREDVTDFIVKKLLSDKNYLIYTSQPKGRLSLYRLN